MRLFTGGAWRLALAAALALFGAGCSSPSERPEHFQAAAADSRAALGAGGAGEAMTQTDSHAAGAAGVRSRCLEGKQIRCLVVHDLANGVRSCWEGVRICRGGQWGACERPAEPQSFPLD